MNALETELRALLDGALEWNRPLAEFTSFRIGGPADIFLVVKDEEQLSTVMAAADRHSVPVFCLGAGTNLLVSDRGIRGLVLTLGPQFATVEVVGGEVSAGAAVQFRNLVEKVVELGLAGLEFGEGIPGTVGGGLVMNAGAFGGEIARVVTFVHGVTHTGEQRTLTNQDIGFAYRRSTLPRGFVITRVDFALQPGDRDALWNRVCEIRTRRAARQPANYPNAGSVFKNPPANFAGRLLEAAGFKGERIGQAAFSSEHANFIVNLGGARASEVRHLIELAREKVHQTTGVLLETEVKLVGEW
ncbi:MAG TPA: UDP-N-acetylmuramate dehydrogenase [Candidatus Binataceae bacterium]|nr:UDP-N-acetylmuramate dehydrogenase [Candidatus Binataceae bacterium]